MRSPLDSRSGGLAGSRDPGFCRPGGGQLFRRDRADRGVTRCERFAFASRVGLLAGRRHGSRSSDCRRSLIGASRRPHGRRHDLDCDNRCRHGRRPGLVAPRERGLPMSWGTGHDRGDQCTFDWPSDRWVRRHDRGARRMSIGRFRAVVGRSLPLPGRGRTVERFAALYQIGCDDLELARLAEAHFDATAIAAETGRDLVRGGVRESGSSIALWRRRDHRRPMVMDCWST